MPDTLETGQSLYPGQSLTSESGQYELTLQLDGNLVLYRVRDRRQLWASKTAGIAVSHVMMQLDGNLVMTGPNGPVWTSNTYGRPGATLKVKDTGGVTIYAVTPVWWTNTEG